MEPRRAPSASLAVLYTYSIVVYDMVHMGSNCLSNLIRRTAIVPSRRTRVSISLETLCYTCSCVQDAVCLFNPFLHAWVLSPLSLVNALVLPLDGAWVSGCCCPSNSGTFPQISCCPACLFPEHCLLSQS